MRLNIDCDLVKQLVSGQLPNKSRHLDELTHEPSIWQCDTGQWLSCFDRLSIDHIVNGQYKRHGFAKTHLRHPSEFLENKSGRIFCVRQVYLTKSCQQLWERVNQYFTLFIHHIWNSNMRRCFYHIDLRQNAAFHNFSRQIALIQYSEPYEARVGF